MAFFGQDIWREFDRLRRDMDTLFQQNFGALDMSQPMLEGPSSGQSSERSVAVPESGSLLPRRWQPMMDVRETDKEILLDAELPGMDKQDIKIELDNDLLRIHGETKREKKDENERFRRVERSYGSFSRSMRLPQYALKDQIQADYKNGVLHLRIPKDQTKAETPKTRQIPLA